MRVFEVVLVVTLVVAMVPRTARLSPFGAAAVLLPLGAAMGLHGVLEGGRWQLVPVYATAVAVVAWRLVVGMRRSMPQRRRPRWALPAGLAVVVGGVLAAVALPVPDLPAPDGPLAVGTRTWTVVDEARPEPYGDRTGVRRLVAQAWYPTPDVGRPAPWVTDGAAFSREVAPRVGLPGFALRHLGLAELHATAGAPLATGDWPVVVLSHGWTGFRTLHADLAEQLASHGFVVVALDHTHAAAVTLFPDGTVVPLDPSALPEEADVGVARREQAEQQLEATFAADVASLLHDLDGDGGPLPTSQLGLDEVGLVGHSTGGGGAYRFCLVDDRCAAVVGLDPWVEPIPSDLRDTGLDVPVLSIRSEEWQGNDNDAVLTALHEDSPGSLGMLAVPGALHADFTLQPFLSPLARLLGLRGDVDAAAMHDAVDTVVRQVMTDALTDEPTALDPPGPLVADEVPLVTEGD